MTTQEIIDYYANLLILQYRGKDKAYATIQAVAKMAVMDQLPTIVQGAFDLDSASGVQLDVLGKYIGVSRNGYDFNGPVLLNDFDYLSLIKIKIIENNSGSSLSDIQNLIFMFFNGVMLVFDHKNMRMDYAIDSNAVSLEVVEVFIKQGFLPKPMGVHLGTLIFAPVIDSFFGFRTYKAAGSKNSPFNTYSNYQTNRPWLRYSDGVSI